MPEVEEKILECILDAHPGLGLSSSVLQKYSSEDPITDIENAALAAYLPVTEAPLPPPLYHILKACCSSYVKVTPSANTAALQDALKRDKKKFDILEMERRRQHAQRRITDFLGPFEASSFSS
ncbi:hypothetical protein L211DRAFT_852367 [Terfezia boudieri ATCC MYA-4762]|uniref:Uncharacterized protein n=1 Tax=Terfezia boudieri ATCC MYA-4762 TaxID=1051890 RepID=A0A3N4L8F6_9PEZI|nr:hypothetical protein L211DRAFT_853696 [Terfezia boudieri ATCC MYA-4762]RPB20413.1 hypothetical protein L211DRAFT_852367 [Terfezia boudieri ATCC MYA-4762]